MYGAYSNPGYTGKSSRYHHGSFSYNQNSSVLPSKPSFELYSTSYSSSYSKPTARSNDIVRPRTRHSSTSSRNVRSRREVLEREEKFRSRTDYTQSQKTAFSSERGRDSSTRRQHINSTLNSASRDHSLPRARAASPATRKPHPVPEFTTIQSNSRVRVGRTSSLDRSARTRAPTNIIEVKRTVIKSDDQHRQMESYSPSFYENSQSKKNREYSDKVSLPSISTNSSRREEVYQNGYEESHSSNYHFREPNAGLVGLKNIGNTCFMNSILQCLSNTKSLRNYCIDEKYVDEMNPKSPMKGRLMEAFSEIVTHLWHPVSDRALSTSGFKNQIQKFSKRFSGYDQQDSQEFLRFLIEGLHEDVNKATEKRSRTMPDFDSLCEESKAEKTWQFYLSKDSSFIVHLFMGLLKSSLECQECNHVSVTFDPFWDLSLPLPKNSYRGYEPSGSVSVTSCLENFTREEILDRDERPTCDKCKRRRKMTKKFTIHKFPKILVIHLKRFSEGSFRQKLTVKVDFTHKLEISHPVSTSDAAFNLYAVSNHSGSCYGGHYTAYCKSPETKQWHCFSDSNVSSMSECSVQSREAYVLFYEQLPTKSYL